MEPGHSDSLVKRMEDWGYYLLPKSHPDSPGYSGLLVAIRDKPTMMHFDPEEIHLRIRDVREEASWVTLSLEPFFHQSTPVCASCVRLHDRIGKETRFFTFGGALRAEMIPGETVYALTSPAPILACTPRLGTVADDLAAETEELIARQEAKWGRDEHGFARQLAYADPLQLYLAVVQTLLQHLESSSAMHQQYEALHHTLRLEKEWLIANDEWPVRPVSLDEVLPPPAEAR